MIQILMSVILIAYIHYQEIMSRFHVKVGLYCDRNMILTPV